MTLNGPNLKRRKEADRRITRVASSYLEQYGELPNAFTLQKIAKCGNPSAVRILTFLREKLNITKPEIQKIDSVIELPPPDILMKDHEKRLLAYEKAVQDASITFEQYQEQALRTESILPQDTKIDKSLLWVILRQAIISLEFLDMYKKRMFYSKPINLETVNELFNESVFLLKPVGAHCTRNYTPQSSVNIDLRLIHAILGLATEAGELLTTLARCLINDDVRQEDSENLAEECSDQEWYKAQLYSALGLDESVVRKKNIAKLKARYGEKFSSEDAINRNTELEMEAFRKA